MHDTIISSGMASPFTDFFNQLFYFVYLHYLHVIIPTLCESF